MSTTEQARFILPLIIVFVSFLGTVACYAVLRLQGIDDVGPVDDMVTGLGVAVAALATPAGGILKTSG